MKPQPTQPSPPLSPPAGGQRDKIRAALPTPSLRALLVAILTALVIGASLTVGFFSYQGGREAMANMAQRLLGEIAERIDLRLTRVLSTLPQIVEANAALIRQGRLDPADSAALERHFASQLGLFPGVDSIGLVTEGGEFVMLASRAPDDWVIRRRNAATGWHFNRYRTDREGREGELLESRQNFDPHDDPPGRPWYPAARAATAGTWRLSVSLAQGQDRPLLVSFYALPVRDGRGVLQGVLVAGMTLTGIGDYLQGLRISAQGQALLLDREGLLVATSTGETPFDPRPRGDHAQNVAVETRRLPAIASADPLTREAARQLLMRHPRLAEVTAPLNFWFDHAGEPYLAQVAVPAREISHPDWLSLVVAPQADFTDPIAAQLRQSLLWSGLGLLIAVLLGLMAANAISRPLTRLSAASRRLAAGDFAQSLPSAPIRELREMERAFDAMARRLGEAFTEQRQINRTLKLAQRELAHQNQDLEQQVAERTAKLMAARDQLTAALARVETNERHMLRLLDRMPMAIATSSLPDDRVTYLNEQFRRVLGYGLEDIPTVGDWALHAYPDPEEREAAMGWWAAAVARAIPDSGQVESREFRVTCKDGAHRDIVISATILDGLMVVSFVDMTERNRTAAALAESEARYRLALDASNDGLWDWDLATGVVIGNERWFTLFGYRPGEVPATVDLWKETLHPDDAAATMCAQDDYLQGRAPDYWNEHRVVTRSGEVRWHRSVGKVVARDAQGQPTRMVGTNADITDRVLAEQRLRESLRLLELATRIADLGVGTMDLVSGTLDWDARLRAMYEVPEETPASELSYDYWMQCIHPEDRELVQTRVQAALRDGTPAEYGFRILLPSGRVRHIHISGVIERDAQGQPFRVIAVSRDITARHLQEAALRDSEERFRLAFEHANTGMCLVDLQGRVLKINDRLAAFFGRPREEVEGRGVNDFAEPEDQALSPRYMSHAVRGEGDHTVFEKRYRHRDGHLIWGQVAASLVRDAQGQPQYFISQVQDITERKHYEQALEQARVAAEAANRAKSEFLAHMSHEIRTPLNVVLGLAQVLARGALTADQQEMLGRIRAAGEALLGIINDLLDLSKIEAGQLRLEPRPFALGDLLTRVEGLMVQSAQAKGLAFQIEAALPGPGGGRLVGDALRLEQVLVNLLGNAIKFTAAGRVSLTVRPVGADPATPRLRFEVRDTGIGIAPEDLDKLFVPFSQADAGISRRYGGTGLGLAICRRLVTLMDGAIGVESQPGQGSTFWFEVPLRRMTEEAPPLPAPRSSPTVGAPPPIAALPSPVTGQRLAGVPLLVVDDSAMNRDLMARALAVEGARATLAVDGQEALELLKTRGQDFAAVLMDIRMPVMDGLTATRRIRDDLGQTELPVIALTAGVLPEEQAAARAAGIDDILAKPLDLERMVALLLTWLGPRPTPLAMTPGPAARSAADPASSLVNPELEPYLAASTLKANLNLFLVLLRGFVEEFATAVPQTRQDLARDKRPAAARRLHNLRGNAGTLGALDLMAVAADLERAIDGGAADVEPGLADLERRLQAFLAAVRPALAGSPDSPIVAGDQAQAIPARAGAGVDPDPTQAIAGLRHDLARRNLQARRTFNTVRPALVATLGENATAALGLAIQQLRFAEALSLLDAPSGAEDDVA